MTCWCDASARRAARIPLPRAARCIDGIRRERDAAAQTLRELADRIIDTSAFTVHELRAALRELLEAPPTPGAPDDLAGLRSATSTACRPTPTSRSTAASCRIRSSSRSCVRRPAPIRPWPSTCSSSPDGTEEFLEHVARAAARSRCRATSARARSYLTIAIGCTGGRHRSVVLVEELRAPPRGARTSRPGAPSRPRTLNEACCGAFPEARIAHDGRSGRGRARATQARRWFARLEMSSGSWMPWRR